MAKTKRKPLSDNIDLLRSAATGRWRDILAHIARIPFEILDGKHHPCPKCSRDPSDDRFRLIDESRGAVLCNQCFRTKNGDGFAAIQWMTGGTFWHSVKQVANYLGVELSGTDDPGSRLEFKPWNDVLVMRWCTSYKKGVTLEAVQACGGTIAKYRNEFMVLAFPVWGPDLKRDQPVGYCLFPLGAGMLPKWKKEKIEWTRKPILTKGSRPGFIGPVDQWETATELWKLEGPSDTLAFLSLSPPAGVAPITNANGSGENPKPWMLDIFAGKIGHTLHDADTPGEDGAAKWALAIATKATQSFRHHLPYQVVKDHGKDFRDWVLERNEFSDLADLPSELVPVPTEPIFRPIEADDDPHRLARVNIERFASLTNGGCIRYWRDEWYLWKDGYYQRMGPKEFKAKLAASIKAEFDRLNVLKQHEETDEPPQVQKVTPHLVVSVAEATASMTLVSSKIELNMYVPDRRRRNWIAMRNGIVDVDALLAGKEIDDVLRPLSPDWWSMTCLPFEFDPQAQCPQFMKVLDRCLEGDRDRVALLQEWAGYLLLPDTSQQKFMVLEGEGGNGKTVFLCALIAMLGQDNISAVPLERFGDQFSLYQTVGKLANISGDMGQVDGTVEGYLKTITGGDLCYFDRKGLSPIACRPTARLMFATNNRPRFTDKSIGIWRRIILVPWNVKITQEERILDMDSPEWWIRSGELPGIFRWAVIGLHRLRQNRAFTTSETVEEAIADYRRETNPAREFLETYLKPDPECRIHPAKLYEIYRAWAHQSGYHALGNRSFGREIHRVFNVERKRHQAEGDRDWHYFGISFTTHEIAGKSCYDAQSYGDDDKKGSF